MAYLCLLKAMCFEKVKIRGYDWERLGRGGRSYNTLVVENVGGRGNNEKSLEDRQRGKTGRGHLCIRTTLSRRKPYLD